jgi:hypothetical protein
VKKLKLAVAALAMLPFTAQAALVSPNPWIYQDVIRGILQIIGNPWIFLEV